MMASKSFVFRFEDVEVREQEFTLTKAGKVLTVEPKAFRALLFLLHNSQKLISKEELLNSVWGDAAVTEGSLTRCIWLLRSVLGDDIRSPRYIETVATVGYRFVCKVEVSEEAADEPAGAEEPGDRSGVEKTVGSRKRLWGWVLACGGVLALCLAGAIWYLRRPLPPPRITKYTQITHDGLQKNLVGTDGTRLYFNQMSGALAPESIDDVAISGGVIAQVPVATPSPFLLDVSPDGSSFLSGGVGNPVWNVRILGGSARRLAVADCAAFSPDGNSVAYTPQQGGDIWVEHSDGTGAHQLISAGDDVCHIAWSPDGGAIRFTMTDRIWEMSSTGSGLHEVIPGWHNPAEECCGRWTPDGKLFLFLSEGQIWALDERRTLFRQPPAAPVQLTQGPILWGGPIPGSPDTGFDWGGPIPGKDGSRVFAVGIKPRGELSRFDSKSKQFLPFLGGISAQGVVFSNDGKSIAYVSYPEGILWKANRDGSNPLQLTDPPMEAFLPRWSPDSKQIFFYDMSPGQDAGDYIVSSDGGSPRKLVFEDRHLGLSTWSPDGDKMAGDSTSADGASIIRILDFKSRKVTTVPGSNGMGGPLWSPDGRYLAAVDGEDHPKIFDFKTQQWSELAQKGDVQSPQWSHDSQFIYFKRTKGDRGVFRIAVKGGAEEKIADLKDWHDASWWGDWMGLDPTDTPLLLRDIGSYDIYALNLDQK